ncbi:MAG: AraC family transcriptional regulator [Lachnospiraceae bacterium]|nr:AraC family transcriptional regulator [Lachnospiraceae bacterium]
MPLPLPSGKPVQVTYRMLDKDFGMQSMAAAPDHYALLFVIHGDRYIITPTMTYTLHPGEINAMEPYLYHKTMPASDKYYESILVKFAPRFIDPLIEKLGAGIIEQIFEYPPKTFDKKDADTAFALAKEMLDIGKEYDAEFEAGKNSENISYLEFKLQNLLYRILILIYEKSKDRTVGEIHKTVLSKPIIDAVFYMESNYMGNIKLEDAASVAGYSSAYFSRLFQTQLGTSFSEYLNLIRLRHVQHDLLTTEKSITEIAMENGFTYPGNMTDSFKRKVGMTPNKFRKNRK